MYLLIQNDGEAPLEAFTLLGDSGTRGRDNSGLIGQFGSGTKQAICLLKRHNIHFKIFSGKTGMEFGVDPKYVEEADGNVREAFPVFCRLSGTSTRRIECGFSLEMGRMDWTEVRMGIREFVANAIDCSTIMGSKPVIKVVDKPRAQVGKTRIYIDLRHPDVEQFYKELGQHFLHFSHDPSQVTKRFLRKDPSSTGPRIYLEGVHIRTLNSSKQAVFDYNFRKGEIQIDECRNSSEYALRAAIAQVINRADPDTLATLFEKLAEGDTYEGSLDDFYLGYHNTSEQKENWVDGWYIAHGETTVIANETMASSPLAEHVQAKGHKIKAVKSDSFVKVAQAMGVKDVATVLGEAGAAGKIPTEVTEAAINAVRTTWDWVEAAGMTGGKGCPEVACFKQLMDGEGECLGYYRPGDKGVHIREDLDGKIALKTAIEEVAHYITGSTDCSRDFQNFAFDMIVELCV
jgi:hypothetical protein